MSYPKFTSQETFDIVSKHLLKQGERSVRDGGGINCAYHGNGGLKCAAGALIPDGDYTVKMEGKSVHALCKSDWFGHDEDVVGILQQIHDKVKPVQWEGALEYEARTLGIKFNGGNYE